MAKDTGLTIALGGNPEIWDIVEIHAQEPNDAMKKAFVALLTAIEPPYTNDKAGMLYESNIGKEYATDGNGNIKRVLFSAPNDIEKEYRIDIYTTAFKE